MPADVNLVAPVRVVLRFRDDVGSGALSESPADVLVVTDQRLREYPDALIAPRNGRKDLSREVVELHAMAVRVLHEVARDGPEVRLRIDVLPPHLEELPAALRRDKSQPEPGARVPVLRLAGVPDSPDLFVHQHAVAARLLRRLLDPIT